MSSLFSFGNSRKVAFGDGRTFASQNLGMIEHVYFLGCEKIQVLRSIIVSDGVYVMDNFKTCKKSAYDLFCNHAMLLSFPADNITKLVCSFLLPSVYFPALSSTESSLTRRTIKKIFLAFLALKSLFVLLESKFATFFTAKLNNSASSKFTWLSALFTRMSSLILASIRDHASLITKESALFDRICSIFVDMNVFTAPFAAFRSTASIFRSMITGAGTILRSLFDVCARLHQIIFLTVPANEFDLCHEQNGTFVTKVCQRIGCYLNYSTFSAY